MTQRWQPDTCGCVVDESYATGSRVYVGTVAACPSHQPLSGTPAHLAVLIKENRAKNVAVNAAQDVLKESVTLLPQDGAVPSQLVDNQDGSFTLVYRADQLQKKWMPQREPKFSYEEGITPDKRKLVLEVEANTARAADVLLAIIAQNIPGISEIVIKPKVP